MNENANTMKSTSINNTSNNTTTALLYNKGNYPATEIVFTPSLDDVKKDVRNICGAYLNDIKDVIIQVDRVNGAITCYVTIPSNSSSLRDKANIGVAKDTNISINIPAYSRDLVKLTELFSPSESTKMVFRDTTSPKGDTAVKIDLLKIFAAIFDTSGQAWSKLEGGKPPRMDLQAVPGYANKDGKFDKVTHFTIVKRLFVPRHQTGRFKPSAPLRIK